MSLYNMLFGQNPLSDLLLGLLGLRRADVGRFRDCFIHAPEEGGEPQIAVYTRNGGGNRDCWHDDDPEWGNPECKHHVVQRETPELAFMPKEQWPDGKPPGNYFHTENGVYGCSYATGKTIMVDRHVCESPCSADCACPGCVVQHRLPAHPLYVRDADDDFDCTYATIYFRVPEPYRDAVRSLISDGPTPAQKWDLMLAALRGADADDPMVKRATSVIGPMLAQIDAKLAEPPP